MQLLEAQEVHGLLLAIAHNGHLLAGQQPGRHASGLHSPPDLEIADAQPAPGCQRGAGPMTQPDQARVEVHADWAVLGAGILQHQQHRAAAVASLYRPHGYLDKGCAV